MCKFCTSFVKLIPQHFVCDAALKGIIIVISFLDCSRWCIDIHVNLVCQSGVLGAELVY